MGMHGQELGLLNGVVDLDGHQHMTAVNIKSGHVVARLHAHTLLAFSWAFCASAVKKRDDFLVRLLCLTSLIHNAARKGVAAMYYIVCCTSAHFTQQPSPSYPPPCTYRRFQFRCDC